MKLYIFLSTVVLLVLAEGTGAWTKHMLGIDRAGFNAPLGFAVMLSACQLFYYPAQIFNFSFRYIIIVTVIVLLLCVVLVFFDLDDIRRSLFRSESLVVLAAGILFIVLCQRQGVVSISSKMPSLSMTVSAMKMPRFQGYFQFSLAWAWLQNLPYHFFSANPILIGSAEIYGLGMLYILISSMLVVDIVRRLSLRNHWFEFALGVYLLMNGNYTAWSLGTAWLGLSWSFLFITLSVSLGYRYVKEENEMIKYLLLPVFAAGLACDNSFGLAGVAVLYGFMVYLFSIRKIRSLFDLFTLLIPHVLYAAAVFGTQYPLSWIIVLLYAWFCVRRYKKPLRRWITRAEEFCFDYYKEIFLIAVPVVCAAASIVIGFLRGWQGITSYAYYFSDFTEIDGMRDYLFIHSDVLDMIINLFRWGGLVCLIWLAKEPCDRALRILLLTNLIVFINPLCTPAIAYMTGPQFIHIYNVLFNPFTEAILFLFIYRMFQWTVIGQWVLEITLCLGALIGVFGIL